MAKQVEFIAENGKVTNGPVVEEENMGRYLRNHYASTPHIVCKFVDKPPVKEEPIDDYI